jgi:thiol-disulfide isomerase/thioredoxin
MTKLHVPNQDDEAAVLEAFANKVSRKLDEGVLVVVYFYSSYVRACDKLTQALIDMSLGFEYGDLEIVAIEVSGQHPVSTVLKIEALPTCVLFRKAVSEDSDSALVVGARVMAKKRPMGFANYQSSAKYPAEIVAVNEDGTLHLRYDDEEKEDKEAPESLIGGSGNVLQHEVARVGYKGHVASVAEVSAAVKSHIPVGVSKWRQELVFGSKVDVCHQGSWYPGVVVEIDGDEVTIHFEKVANCENKKYDWDSKDLKARGVASSYAVLRREGSDDDTSESVYGNLEFAIGTHVRLKESAKNLHHSLQSISKGSVATIEKISGERSSKIFMLNFPERHGCKATADQIELAILNEAPEDAWGHLCTGLTEKEYRKRLPKWRHRESEQEDSALLDFPDTALACFEAQYQSFKRRGDPLTAKADGGPSVNFRT